MRRWPTAIAALAAVSALGWALFHPQLRPDPATISAEIRAELARTGFASKQAFERRSDVIDLDGNDAIQRRRAKVGALPELFLRNTEERRIDLPRPGDDQCGDPRRRTNRWTGWANKPVRGKRSCRSTQCSRRSARAADGRAPRTR